MVGLAALAIQSRDPQGSMAILTADHLMRNAEHLRQLLKAAYAVAQKDYLVTLGITPTFPATGYGYIEKGEAWGFLRAWKLSGCKLQGKTAAGCCREIGGRWAPCLEFRHVHLAGADSDGGV